MRIVNILKKISEIIQTVVNTILLSIVYIVGVGMTSLIAKITGKKFLDLNIQKDKESYWEDLELGKKELKDYYRQF